MPPETVAELADVGSVLQLAFSPTGKYLAGVSLVSSGQSRLRVWDWRAGREVAQKQLAQHPRRLIWANGTTLVTAGKGHLQVWTLAKPLGVAARNRPLVAGARKLIIRPCNLGQLGGADFVDLATSSGLLYALTAAGTVAALQGPACEVVCVADIKVDRAVAIGVSQAGIAVAAADGRLWLLSGKTLEIRDVFRPPARQSAECVACWFARRSELMVAAFADGQAVTWEVEGTAAGKEPGALKILVPSEAQVGKPGDRLASPVAGKENSPHRRTGRRKPRRERGRMQADLQAIAADLEQLGRDWQQLQDQGRFARAAPPKAAEAVLAKPQEADLPAAVAPIQPMPHTPAASDSAAVRGQVDHGPESCASECSVSCWAAAKDEPPSETPGRSSATFCSARSLSPEPTPMSATPCYPPVSAAGNPGGGPQEARWLNPLFDFDGSTSKLPPIWPNSGREERARSSKATWQLVSPARKSSLNSPQEYEKVELELARPAPIPTAPESPAAADPAAAANPRSARSHSKSPLGRIWKSVTSWRRSHSRSRLSQDRGGVCVGTPGSDPRTLSFSVGKRSQSKAAAAPLPRGRMEYVQAMKELKLSAANVRVMLAELSSASCDAGSGGAAELASDLQKVYREEVRRMQACVAGSPTSL